MSEPGNWIETLNWTGPLGAKLLAILLAPAVIGVTKWAKDRFVPTTDPGGVFGEPGEEIDNLDR
jgi:hypothetical protein